jgi:hypothetical protein
VRGKREKLRESEVEEGRGREIDREGERERERERERGLSLIWDDIEIESNTWLGTRTWAQDLGTHTNQNN